MQRQAREAAPYPAHPHDRRAGLQLRCRRCCIGAPSRKTRRRLGPRGASALGRRVEALARSVRRMDCPPLAQPRSTWWTTASRRTARGGRSWSSSSSSSAATWPSCRTSSRADARRQLQLISVDCTLGTRCATTPKLRHGARAMNAHAWSHSRKLGQHVARLRPSWGRHWPKPSRVGWPRFGQISSKLALMSAKPGPGLANLGKLGRAWAVACRLRPTPERLQAKLVRNSKDMVGSVRIRPKSA